MASLTIIPNNSLPFPQHWFLMTFAFIPTMLILDISEVFITCEEGLRGLRGCQKGGFLELK